MLCTICRKDLHPVIDLFPSGPMFVCADPGCHSPIGPANKPAAPAATPIAEAVRPALATVAPLQVAPRSAVDALPAPVAIGGYVAQMRERLKLLDATLEPLIEERDYLRKMFSASKGRKRTKRARNVIPIARANNA